MTAEKANEYGPELSMEVADLIQQLFLRGMLKEEELPKSVSAVAEKNPNVSSAVLLSRAYPVRSYWSRM